MNRPFSLSAGALVAAISLNAFTHAAPGILNHQGRIAVGGANFDGTGHFKFALVDGGARETFWTNDGSNTGRPGGEPNRSVPLAVSRGHYSVLLGDTGLANMNQAVPASLFEDEDEVMLRVWFGTHSTGPFELLTPDRRLTPAPYALHAAKAGGVTDGSITAAMLADGSVTADKLADGTITVADLATEEVYDAEGATAINNPDPASNDGFGYAVAGVGTDKVLVGALFDDSGTNDAGSAYLFDTSGNLLATLNNPDPAGDDRFGISVDGVGTDKLIVGASGDDSGASEAGSAYLFDTSGTLLVTINNPDPASNELFGISVAAVGTDKLIVGAPGDDTGAVNAGSAYLFDTSGTLLATLNNPDPELNDLFGISVAAVGADRLLVGAHWDDTGASDAGSAYLFDVSGTLLTTLDNPDPANGDNFGLSVAGVGADRLLVGASKDDTGASDAGSAYLFDTAGTLLATLNNPDPANGDLFGISVAGVGSDKLIVGATRDDPLADDTGLAYLFDTAGTLLATINNPDPANGDRFGISVAAVGSDRLVVGASEDGSGAIGAGSAYLFLPGQVLPQLLSGRVVEGAIRSTSIADGTILAADLAPGASDDADADPANELQSLSLSGDDLSISGGNSVGLDQYLRSSGSDSYSGGKLTFETGSNLEVAGELIIKSGGPGHRIVFDDSEQLSWNDNFDFFFFSDAVSVFDSLYFNNNTNLRLDWVDAADRFEFSEKLEISSQGNAPQLRLEQGRFGFPARLELANTGGLWQIAANGGFFGDLRFNNGFTDRMILEDNGDLFIDGSLHLGENEGDQHIYFFDAGSSTDEFLRWDESQDQFAFSENLEINSAGNAPQLRLEQQSTSNFARLELATVDGGNWQIAVQSGASGDLRFYNGSTNRMVLEDNGDLFIDGSLNPPSDRDKKENFQAVDPAEVLQKVAKMEITRWNYKHDKSDTPHLGPVAQDFHAAFGLGVDDKHIATVDADGIALAAIQGLNAKLEADNAAKDKKIAELEERLKALETLLTNPNSPPANHE